MRVSVNLHTRLARLERTAASSPDRRCAVCGLPPPGTPLPEAVKIIVDEPALFGTHDADRANDQCPACGALRVLRLRFDRDG